MPAEGVFERPEPTANLGRTAATNAIAQKRNFALTLESGWRLGRLDESLSRADDVLHRLFATLVTVISWATLPP